MKKIFLLPFLAFFFLGVCSFLLMDVKRNNVPGEIPNGKSSGFTTNYASAYLGATLTDFSPACKGASAVLNEDKEKYMLCACTARRKMFTVQLIREIEVRMITLVNLEHFSSGVKNFTLLASKKYPTTEWRVLGSFEATPWRGTQHFDVSMEEPVRFLRLLWVTSHGHDAWCTLTTLRVFGVDVLETLTENYGQEVDDLLQKTLDAAPLALPRVSAPSTSGLGDADGPPDALAMKLSPQGEKKPRGKKLLSALLDQVGDIVAGAVDNRGGDKHGDHKGGSGSNNSNNISSGGGGGSGSWTIVDYCSDEAEDDKTYAMCRPEEYRAYVARSRCTCPARPAFVSRVTLQSKSYQGGTALQILAQMSKHLKILQTELDESYSRQEEMRKKLEHTEKRLGILGTHLHDTLRITHDYRDKFLELKREVDVMNSRFLLRLESDELKKRNEMLWMWVVCSNVVAFVSLVASLFLSCPQFPSGGRRFSLRRFSQ